jgi:hypothetical protein
MERTPRHQAIIDLLITHCGLMDMLEEDEENKPILAQVMEDEQSAAEYLLNSVSNRAALIACDMPKGTSAPKAGAP